MELNNSSKEIIYYEIEKIIAINNEVMKQTEGSISLSLAIYFKRGEDIRLIEDED